MQLQQHLSADPQLSQSLQPQLYPPLDLLAPWHKSGVKSLVAEALVYQYKHLGVLKTLTAKGTCYVWLETLLCKNKELEGCQDCCCNTTAIATWYMHFRTTSQVSYKSNVLILVDNAVYLHSRWNGNCYQTTCQPWITELCKRTNFHFLFSCNFCGMVVLCFLEWHWGCEDWPAWKNLQPQCLWRQNWHPHGHIPWNAAIRQQICKRAKNKTDLKSRKRRIHQYVSPNAWVMRASALKFGASWKPIT